jgi:hypothetical protein
MKIVAEKTEQDVLNKVGDILYLLNVPTPRLKMALQHGQETDLQKFMKRF